MSWVSLGVAALIFFGLSWILAHSLPAKWALIVVPITLFIISDKLMGEVVGLITLGGGLILLSVLSSGSHEYETKDGRADKRYKSNKYTPTFSEEFREFSKFGLIGIGIEIGVFVIYQYFLH